MIDTRRETKEMKKKSQTKNALLKVFFKKSSLSLFCFPTIEIETRARHTKEDDDDDDAPKEEED